MSKEGTEQELRDIYDAAMQATHDPKAPVVRGRTREAMLERARLQAATKTRISARFDADLVARYKQLAQGGSYQSLMNQALREWLERQELRQVVREEVQRALADQGEQTLDSAVSNR